jgi:hypothetical protein
VAGATADAAAARSDPAAPLSVEQVGAWAERARSTGLGRAAYADRHAQTWETALERLMGIVGAPRDPEAEFSAELDALDAVGQVEPLALWSRAASHRLRLADAGTRRRPPMVAPTQTPPPMSRCSTRAPIMRAMG